ncbi:response regulator [Oceanispirochaeta crateris]|uniref:Response regulator n=1 Tax=Oceanispirochaeta crateris TaxID=2518645 RepID=A0A5C1QIS7_9SPIO|nr:HD domain-containing phosphohydrolase [Oceanispirochaeta crateris]QEN08085.1 response regulator [Oceanispirochaeta crateris]
MHKVMFNRVFIIDDDSAIRKVLQIQLENSGFSVGLAISGEDALEILNQGAFKPDCIFTDIRMPGISGLELLPILKDRLPLVPVIMLTAHTDLDTGLSAMRLGAYDYMTKPMRRQDLLANIHKALDYRAVLFENERLTRESLKYQETLEQRVKDRTQELFKAYQRLKDTNLATVRVLAETIEAKDPYTRGHCNRVRMFSRETALHLGLDSETIEILEYGALLHDIGKIGIPESLLHKQMALDAHEISVFEEHPIIGENILKLVDFFTPCLGIVRHHHEWYDGTGYPDKIKGQETEVITRIVQITDAYDAMTSNRPYRSALAEEFALEELKRGRGTQFDSEIVDLFISKNVYLITDDTELSRS